ncbi:MAG TPA: hypothetical protein PLX34_20745 [Sedimentisphaerales bacterium]|jgi:hypothetical protein|nr:hypothetical protein [Sedimentisphaerales bacterium]HQN36209.1 hypothetical protein [Sedimentisphaerales bacterium]
MDKKTKLTRTQIKGQVRMIADAAEGLLSFSDETLQRGFGVTKEEVQRNIVALLQGLTEEI